MASTLKVARGKAHAEYVRLRLKILDHYSLLDLVGRVPSSTQRKPSKRPPPKLGHWDPGTNGHSEHVLAACPELGPVVHAIEKLLKQRDPKYVKARHTPLRRVDNFRRHNPKNQLNPGEWPPKYK